MLKVEELPLVRSSRIGAGFAHGFSTRAGGVSEAPFDALNLGGKWGDEPAAVSENRRRLAAALGVGGPLYTARQVHGGKVARVRAGDDPEALARVEADAIYTSDPGVALGVFVADCIPMLIADRRTGACAAVHAGWRGTVAGVAPAVVRVLGRELGSRPADLSVAMGPAIGLCCFEVGTDVVAAFVAALSDFPDAEVVMPSPRGVPGKWHIDLKAANRLLLLGAGVPEEAIDAGPECTCCDRERFFSFRRDRDRTGQLMGVIARLPFQVDARPGRR
jgi:polyphenol oxidase